MRTKTKSGRMKKVASRKKIMLFHPDDITTKDTYAGVDLEHLYDLTMSSRVAVVAPAPHRVSHCATDVTDDESSSYHVLSICQDDFDMLEVEDCPILEDELFSSRRNTRLRRRSVLPNFLQRIFSRTLW
ncbi:hypothetical protein SDRG_13152 [Saprolegnia diclina VS20]|uniref:Uncharacterized protein n=1 Tax=Saprolegnia diclina (strain VS20) TaxID=1156394 RepID=T0Q3H2_SAPDV|nr:hypothetical protein SDRG_13152 [Saprolegnia diclina VS20]EQC29121.1 hypothetical protein SDRG_13152 [Saprolegnia diclina VS20]|eukprot:XP_008617456.1 hypothetical protein SDRG_13152 [Saprolegnia diclina VS20]